MKRDRLRMKWARSDLEIVLEKLEMLQSWQDEGSGEENMVKEELLDWMIENKVDTLVEEGEDILDGLEQMVEA